MTQATDSVGTIFSVLYNEVDTPLAEVVSINSIGEEKEKTEITNMDNGGRKKYMFTFTDSPAISLELNFIKSIFEILKFIFDDFANEYTFKVSFPNGVYFMFDGTIENYKISASVGNKLTINCDIAVNSELLTNYVPAISQNGDAANATYNSFEASCIITDLGLPDATSRGVAFSTNASFVKTYGTRQTFSGLELDTEYTDTVTVPNDDTVYYYAYWIENDEGLGWSAIQSIYIPSA